MTALQSVRAFDQVRSLDELATFAAPPHMHRLFRFPARLHFRVARYLVQRYGHGVIADPFAGSGTVLLESTLSGFDSVGFDIDPLSVFITNAKLSVARTGAGPFRLAAELVLGELSAARQFLPSRGAKDISLARYAAPTDIFAVAVLSELEKWIRRYVIMDIAHIRRAIAKHTKRSLAVRSQLLLVLGAIVRNSSIADPVPVSGLEYTAPMRLLDDEGRRFDAIELFRLALVRAERSFNEFEAEMAGKTVPVSISHIADSRSSWPVKSVDTVITSPPYLNAVEYSRRHKLEYLVLGLIDDPKSIRDLASRYIGHRSWGTEALEKDLSIYPPEIAAIASSLAKIDYRRARAFLRYCGSMEQVFQSANEVLAPGGVVVVVVGRSAVGDFQVPTDEALKALAPWPFAAVESYPLKNRYMTYSRRNGADISHEYVLSFRKSC